jgi:hypothetical protein
MIDPLQDAEHSLTEPSAVIVKQHTPLSPHWA